MRYFCTALDQNSLIRGVALHRSLSDHAGEFELVVLCLDESVADFLGRSALSQVRPLSLMELLKRHPRLAGARTDRTPAEFHLTCVPWLLSHLLAQLPRGALLTYVDASVFLFASPAPVFDEIGEASVALLPYRFPPGLTYLERHGKFSASWISLRHDSTGETCATEWAEKCAEWCFLLFEATRYGSQKYLDAWPARFPGTVVLTHPGANLGPWNLKDAALTAGKPGLRVNKRPLISFDFRDLADVGQNLYDPGLHAYDAALTPVLRDQIYRPYLRQLHAGAATGETAPDLLPAGQANDPRHYLAVGFLLAKLGPAERERGTAMAAMEKIRRTAGAAVQDARLEAKEAQEVVFV